MIALLGVWIGNSAIYVGASYLGCWVYTGHLPVHPWWLVSVGVIAGGIKSWLVSVGVIAGGIKSIALSAVAE